MSPAHTAAPKALRKTVHEASHELSQKEGTFVGLDDQSSKINNYSPCGKRGKGLSLGRENTAGQKKKKVKTKAYGCEICDDWGNSTEVFRGESVQKKQ